MTRGEPPQKSSLPTRAAECFRPLHTFMGVASVWKIEMGLECCQWLLRKLKNTVTGAKLLLTHSVSLFSRQQLTLCESSIIFPDLLNPPKLMQRPKMFLCTNRQQCFQRLLTSSHAPAGAQCFSVFLATTDPF
jgi:hypothetical protein